MRARVVTRTRSAGASAASATELWVFATPDATVYAIYAPGFDDALTVLNGVLIRDGWAPYSMGASTTALHQDARGARTPVLGALARRPSRQDVCR